MANNFSDIKKALIDKIKTAVTQIAKEDLRKAIVNDSIALGISPVQGDGRYDKYSTSYTDAIKSGRYSKESKNQKPVNLKLTGQLHNSFFVEKRGDGLIVGFRNKLADIHTTQGAGRSRTIRKMLPVKSGERFKTSIERVIKNLIKRGLDRVLGK